MKYRQDPEEPFTSALILETPEDFALFHEIFRIHLTQPGTHPKGQHAERYAELRAIYEEHFE